MDLFLVIVFILGLAVGSFLNALIFRLHSGDSVLRGRSMCPRCQRLLSWSDLIPVLSFIFLRGKCRYCYKKISWQYPLVELSTTILFGMVSKYLVPASFTGDWLEIIKLVWWWFVISVCIIIFVYDLKHYLILDKVVFPALVVSLLAVFFLPGMSGWRSLLGSAVVGGFFLVLVLLSSERWMGWGDVKLGFLVGLIIGWPNCLALLLIAFVGGAIVSLALLGLKRKGWKDAVPFGTFLTAATIITMFVGTRMVEGYLRLL